MRSVYVIAQLTILGAGAALAAQTSFEIKSVNVVANGLWTNTPGGRETEAQCKKFQISPPAALKWFRAATEVPKEEWLEKYDSTVCYSKGTLLTGDGKTYSWELDPAGRAIIFISSDYAIYLGGDELPFDWSN